jgi:hypothetical protein
MQLLPSPLECVPPKPRLNKIDAHLFLDDAKMLLQGEVGVYKKLLKTLEEFCRDQLVASSILLPPLATELLSSLIDCGW